MTMFRYKSVCKGLLLICICANFYANGDPACPPEELYKPCECSNNWYFSGVTMQCNNFTNEMNLENIFLNVHKWNVKHFFLRNLNMNYVPSTIFEHIYAETVTIGDSTLISLFDKPLGPFYFDFNVGNVKLLRGVDFSLLRNLTTYKIFISTTNIKEIGESFKAGVPEHVAVLDFVNTKTMSIKDGAFENMKELSFLTISDNQLKTLKRNFFARPTPMEELNFRNNKIASLPVDLLDDMPKLRILNLIGNHIVTLPESIFGRKRFWYDLNNNPINCDCDVKWITDDMMERSIYGTCAAPHFLKGRKLKELKQEDFNYCTNYYHYSHIQ